MIAVFSPLHVRIPELSGNSFMGFDLLHCSDWTRFERARVRAQCAILVIPRLTHSFVLQHLHAPRHRSALHPMILVTQKDAEAVRAVVGAPVQEIVWLEEIGARLREAVLRARKTTYLAGVAERIAAALHVPPQLREALVFACHAPQTVDSVAAMARAVGCSRSTLSRQWKQVRPEPCSVRMQDFLDHLLLLRASARRTPDRSWSAASREMDIQERTLRRVARRVAGKSLRHLDATVASQLVSLFEERVLGPILGDATNCP